MVAFSHNLENVEEVDEKKELDLDPLSTLPDKGAILNKWKIDQTLNFCSFPIHFLKTIREALPPLIEGVIYFIMPLPIMMHFLPA